MSRVDVKEILNKGFREKWKHLSDQKLITGSAVNFHHGKYRIFEGEYPNLFGYRTLYVLANVDSAMSVGHLIVPAVDGQYDVEVALYIPFNASIQRLKVEPDSEASQRALRSAIHDEIQRKLNIDFNITQTPPRTFIRDDGSDLIRFSNFIVIRDEEMLAKLFAFRELVKLEDK